MIKLVVGGSSPIVYSDGQVIHEIAFASVIEVNKPGNRFPIQQYIIFEKVGMDNTGRKFFL